MMRHCGGIGSDAAGGGVGASAGFPARDPDRGRPGRVQEPATVHPGLPTRRRVGHNDLLSSWEDRIDLAVARSRRTGTAWRTGGPSAPWWRPTLHCDDVEARTVRNLPSCSEVITGPATARRLSCSRDSVAAACTALVAARRSWSSSTRREKPRFLLRLRQLPGRVQARPACCPSHGLPGPGRLASVRSPTRCGKGLKPRSGLRGQEEPDPASVRPDGQHRRCPARRPGGGHLHRRVRPAGPATPPRPAGELLRFWIGDSPSAAVAAISAVATNVP